jgi:hypothetical protein
MGLFLIVMFLSCALAIALAIRFVRSGRSKTRTLAHLIWVAACIVPVSGALVGGLETHGCSVSWLAFGTAIGVISHVAAALTVPFWRKRDAV